MKFKAQYIVECCEFNHSGTNEHAALDKLLKHIECCHPSQFRALEGEGRKLAQGLNGCGYHDAGKPSGDGWHKAAASFRHSHTRHALAYKLGCQHLFA